MARYGQAFRDRAVAKLLPPESLALEDVARSTSIGEATLSRWLDAASMSEADKSAWCREHGVYPVDLDTWSQNATAALAGATEASAARASPQATRGDKKRIRELERELLRKDRALA